MILIYEKDLDMMVPTPEDQETMTFQKVTDEDLRFLVLEGDTLETLITRTHVKDRDMAVLILETKMKLVV
jgi:hypothetical protein